MYYTRQCGKFVFKVSYNSEFCNMLTLSHKKLEVYQQALLFTKLVYKITERFPKAEQFGLSSQLRRATVSVLSNIAEGVSRSSDKEKIRFLEVSRSSLVEADTQLEIAFSLMYCNKEALEELSPICHQVFAMITGLIRKYNKPE